MKNIKIIAMDFDGTLLTSDKKITERTKKCLTYLKQSHTIIGITARNLLSVKNVLDVSLFDYIILNNGSDIYYVKEDKTENISYINKEITKELYNLYKNEASRIDFCTSKNYLCITKERNDNRPFIKYIEGLDEINDNVSRMNIFLKNEEEVEAKKKKIEELFHDINVVKMLDTDKENSKTWLSINPNNTNKLTTLKKISTKLNYSLNEVVFFGDGENDLLLIENAGIGIAMGNAIESVKEKATYITLSNDEDGIAEYLENNID